MKRLSLRENIAWIARGLVRDISNFHLLHYRHVDGFRITAKNSGTHWLKYMLSNAIAAELGLPPPRYASGQAANDFVGNPKRPPKYAEAPHIGSSHNLPSSLFRLRPLFRALQLPPVVVLVRDIEQAILSNYVKWRDENGLTLADYVHVPAPGRKTVADVWWYVAFFNRWGRMAATFPDRILVVRYEDLHNDPRYWLTRILDHYGVKLSPEAIEAAVEASQRETMRRKLDPNAGELIIPADADRRKAGFSRSDHDRLTRVLADCLEFSFGYRYATAR